MDIIENYLDAKKMIYEHVGLVEDWVVCPLDFNLESFWFVEDGIVKYANTIEQFYSDGDYYQDDLYTQRHYPKHVYVGEIYTLVFCEPHVDGVKWWRIFRNNNKMDSFE